MTWSSGLEKHPEIKGEKSPKREPQKVEAENLDINALKFLTDSIIDIHRKKYKEPEQKEELKAEWYLISCPL